MISICIPCKDNQQSLNRTIRSIRETATDEHEIVVCDDGSDPPLKADCKIVRHKNTVGVGAAIDTAVANSSYPIVAISGDDIVHKGKGWMSKCAVSSMLEPEAIFCSVTKGYNPDSEEFAERSRYGASLILKADIDDIPKSKRFMYPNDWKMLYRSKWNHEPKEEVSTLLGALYIVQRKWYNHLRGFEMHRHWGTLDSYLAMKSWLAGGSCKLMDDVVTGHVFKISGARRPMDWFYYNKALVTRTLFPDMEDELLGYMSDRRMVQVGLDLLNSYKDKSYELAYYFKDIFVRDHGWLKNKFNLK